MRLYGYSALPGSPGINLASTSFTIPGGAAVGRPLLPNMRKLKQGGRRDPSLPPEENIPFSLPQAMVPGAAGNISGMQMAQGMPGYEFDRKIFPENAARGIPVGTGFDHMFPMQPGGLGIPQGMPGYEFDRKIFPENAARGIPVGTGFDHKFVS